MLAYKNAPFLYNLSNSITHFFLLYRVVSKSFLRKKIGQANSIAYPI